MEQNKSCITINCGCCGENNGSNESGNSGVGFPGEEYIDITFPYTAESNGYVYVDALSDESQNSDFYIKTANGMAVRSLTHFCNTHMHNYLPVRAGATAEIHISHATLVSARFYPAV